MGHAYTPGLKVTERLLLRKTRRLPLLGDVVVEKGARVRATDVVARADLPGKVFPVNVANQLGLIPEEIPEAMKKQQGDRVAKGELIAETKGFLGFFKGQVNSPIEGVVDSVSRVTGQVMLRENPIPVTVQAYVDGAVAEVLPREGVVVETAATFIQGIFGLAGERHGPIRVVAREPDDELQPAALTPELKGAVVVGGAFASLLVLRKAIEVGAHALVVGGFNYSDVKELLGYELGVAITGGEKIATTLIVTEGFGRINMARRTFELLKKNEGRMASVNGATQIRAGVIRPEVVIPLEGAEASGATTVEEKPIEVGRPVRCIRFPYFGQIGRVSALPVDLVSMESETMVRVLEVEFEGGQKAVVPRANVELIEG